MSDTRAVRPGRLWPKTPRGSARKFRRAMKRQALEEAQLEHEEFAPYIGELDWHNDLALRYTALPHPDDDINGDPPRL